MEGQLEAFVVLFDIVDFTKSCSGLFAMQQGGAEILSHYLEAAFRKPVEIMDHFGGFVSSFSGDACTVIFPQSSGLCVWSAVQLIIRHFSGVQQFNNLELKIRLAVGFGAVEWRIFTNSYQCEYVFLGEGINEVVRLQDANMEHFFSEAAAQRIGLSFFQKLDWGYIPLDAAHKLELQQGSFKTYPHKSATRKLFCHKLFRDRSLSEVFRSAGFCFISMKAIKPEDISKVITQIHEVADMYQGLVNKLENSDKGFMAVVMFGIPVTYGNTARDLCNFALNLMQRNPKLSIGISIGFVLSCYTGGGTAKEYTAFGHPVNMAAKFMTKAQTGEILTDTQLSRLMGSQFFFQNSGTIKVKGIDYPVNSNLLVHKFAYNDFFRSRQLIGRNEELESIIGIINEGVTGSRNAVIYISGDPGIGKSKLMKEVARLDNFSDKGFQKFFVTCETQNRQSYAAIKQIIVQIFKVNFWDDLVLRRAQYSGVWKEMAGTDEAMIRIESIIGSFLGFEWDDSVWAQLDKTVAETHRKAAFVTLMQYLAKRLAIMIMIDDGQWLDQESLDYLQMLSDAKVKPVMVVSACRYTSDGTVDFALKQHDSFNYDLTALNLEQTGVIIKNILRLDAEAPRETVEFIDSLAQGIPLYIVHLTMDMQEKSKINLDGKLLSKEGYTPNLGIDNIISMRIDNLSEKVQRCLCSASVLGNRFPVEVLSRMLGSKLEMELEEGEMNRIWERFNQDSMGNNGHDLDDLEYIFSHVLIHQVAYDRIMQDEKRILHITAASAMERVFDRCVQNHAEEIALQYALAGEDDKAAGYYTLAGFYFRDQYLFARATNCLERALRIWEKMDNRCNNRYHDYKVVEILNGWSELLIQQGDTQSMSQAGEYLERALALSSKLEGSDGLLAAITQNLMANLMLKLTHHRGAEKLFRKVLNIRKKQLTENDPLIAEVLHDLANLYLEGGNFKQAKECFLQAIAIGETLGSGKSAKLADSYNDLACVYAKLDCKAEAEDLFNKALSMRENTLGRNHVELTESLNDLASFLTDCNREEEAEPLLVRALDIRQRVLGEKHILVAETLHAIALLYQKQDDDRATDFFQRAFEIRKAALDPSDPDIAESYHDMAELLIEQQLYIEAKEYLIKALDIREEKYQPDHPEIAETLNQLGNVYQGMDDNDKAEECFIRANQIQERTLGKDHSEHAETLNDHANLYIEMGKFQEAEKMFLKALEIRKATSGENSPEVGETLNDLANLYIAQNTRFHEAEKYLLEALKIRRNTYDNFHSETGETMNDLGMLYAKMEDFDLAEHFLKRALAVRRKNGETDLKFLESLEELANLFYEKGEYAKAINTIKSVLKTRKSIQGEDHLDYAEAMNDLGIMYLETNDLANATEVFSQALKVRKQKLGDSHPDVGESLNDLAESYREQGLLEQALKLLAEAKHIREESLGKDNIELAETIHEMGKIYLQQRDFAQAEQLFIHARNIRLKYWGKDHSEVAESSSDLARLYYLEGKYEIALPLFEEALTVKEETLPDDHNEISDTLHDMGNLHREMGNSDNARKCYERALLIRKKSLGEDNPDTLETKECLNLLRN
jgi:tetratricopeptide (TPR) repeat protein/class 3 adenylate cyclase